MCPPLPAPMVAHRRSGLVQPRRYAVVVPPGPPVAVPQQPPPVEPETAAEPPVEGQVEEEDVLEETAEFLQDAPEHDRLWFEQKPPRDFDFGE